MKLKRSVLKQLIKECLVEILIEGIDSEGQEDRLVEAAVSSRKQQFKKPQNDYVPSSSKKARKPIINEQAVSAMAGGDSIMADIFRDTATTTLQNQGMRNEQTRVPADNAAAVVADHDPTELFEGAGNWAKLAFMGSEK